MLFLSCFKGFGGITLSKSSPACFFTPGYTKFCVFWCYELSFDDFLRFCFLIFYGKIRKKIFFCDLRKSDEEKGSSILTKLPTIAKKSKVKKNGKML